MKNDQVRGEGHYETSRRDRENMEASVESGRAEEAARNAEPKSELERAEQIGRSRRAEEDILLHDDDEAELDLPR